MFNTTEATDETGVNNVEDYKELRNYLEKQLADLTGFCDPESTEIIKEEAPSFDQKTLLKKHKEKIDEIMHDSREKTQKLLEQNQRIEKIQETSKDLSKMVQHFNAIDKKIRNEVDSLKRHSETKTELPNDEHTKKKLDVNGKPDSQRQTSRSKTQGPKQIRFNDKTCTQSGRPKTQSDDIERPPPNDETQRQQRQIESPPTQPEARDENETDKQKTQTESCKTKAETDQKLQKKKKKPSIITKLSHEYKKGSDVLSSPEPRTGSPAKRPNSTTTFTSHC